MEMRKGPILTEFEYRPRTRVVYGPGTLDRVPGLLRELEAKSLLLVTDRGIVGAGHAGRLLRILEGGGFHVTVFDGVEENPSTRCVDECVASADGRPVDVIVALGGGSPIDAAKGCNFLMTNGGRMVDYWGVGKALRPLKPMIAIPTTAGSGSEVQSFALISDSETHRKMACGDPGAAPRIALLDPELTLTQPPGVTARAGIDTVAHAVETAVTRKRTPFSLMFSHRAFQFAVKALPRVLRRPDDLEARGSMLLAAALAGTAIENSMLGAAHSAANPLTARRGVVHGQAVGMMLAPVVRYNAQDPDALDGYVALARSAALAGLADSPTEAVERVALRIEEILDLAGFPTSLEECGVSENEIPALAEAAAAEWTARFNPRPIDIDGFARVYRAALKGRAGIAGRERRRNQS
jgi:alcohol dehydrogenase